MNKNLRGLLRASLRLCRQNWRGLAATSVLPFLLASIIGTIQLWQMRDIYAAGLAANLNPTVEADANLQNLVEGHILLFLGFFIFNALITAWHFTRIVHFWKSGAAKPFSLMPGELHETAAVVVYGLFVGLVVVAAYFVAVLAITLAAQLLAMVALPASLLETSMGLASLAMLGVLLGIAMRFFAGFPGIAQGATPRPLRDLWPIAKGVGFGLTWRAIAVFAAFVAVSLVLLVIIMIPLLAGSESEIVSPTTHEISPDAGRAIAAVLAPAQVAGQWVRACFLVLFSTFLTLVFARLSGQDAGTQNKQNGQIN